MIINGITGLLIAVVGAFIITEVLIVVVNPRSLVAPPTRQNVRELVDRRATESVGIFSIVIAVLAITVSARQGTPLSNASLTLSASFLILAFFLREVANLTILLYQMQYEAIRFGAILLFLSLYFFVDEEFPEDILAKVLLFAVLLSILYLAIVTLFYLRAQRLEWTENSDQSRWSWIKSRFWSFWSWIKSRF